MKHINLKHAIVLGLLLSTSTYSAVFAESLDKFKETAVDGKVMVTENKTVTGDSSHLSFGGTNNSIYDVAVDVSEGKTLTLTDVNVTNPTITGNGNIFIKNSGKAGAVVTDTGNGVGSITSNNVTITAAGSGIDAYGGTFNVTLKDTLNITAGGIGIHAQEDRENPNNASVINITADKLFVDASKQGIYLTNASVKQDIDIQLKNGAVITSTTTDGGGEAAIQNSNQYKGTLTIHTEQGDIFASGVYAGAWATYGSSIFLTADNTELVGNYGILNNNNRDESEISNITTNAKNGNNTVTANTAGIRNLGGIVTLIADNGINKITAARYGTYASGTNSKVTLSAKENKITVVGTTNGATGIYADTTSDINLEARINNIINAGDIKTVAVDDVDTDFGSAYGIYAVNSSDVTLNAGNQNTALGAVYAGGKASDKTTAVSLIGGSNVIQSAAAIAGAGDLNDGRDIISSLYAEDGAQISVSGAQNVIRTYAEDPEDPNTLERTIWAYNTADITIDGQTYISTDRYEETDEAQKGNSADIAIAAGMATGLNEGMVNAYVPDRATVSVKYDTTSAITGDILSAYAGQVDITPKSDTAQMHITGNILAGNNGILNVNLGNGGTLTGRADDYGDAGVINGSSHTTFFDPAFSSEIFKGGEVNLTMGDNSRWNVTGQSWITRINTEGSSNAIIDLVSANTDRNASAHALTIYEMNGDAVFNMSLDADRTLSDMVYMKNANGEYVVNVVDPVTQEDMYAGRSDGGIFDGLRFATVGKGSTASFRAITWDQGINNIEYEVGTDSYDTSQENYHYDSSTGNGSGDTEKPGSDLVEGFFDSEGTPGAPEANGIMTLAAESQQDVIGTDTGANGTTVDETTNYKLIGVKSTELSDAGKTVVSMSRINYSNAVYMDRLNKRMGEARYLDGDEGLWVRMRHDRIGKSDAFRSMNTMMELGYDRKVGDREDGEHRQGFALDYMRGTADYKNVAGEGDVRRAGVWFYDTWLGDKGHYTDYVLKFGRLSNDFEVYARSTGEKITGDYSNFVYSASAEYGRKKDLGNNWYIEPQAQIQYAHVTDADYTTSQDTHVQLDAIDSLIGRVGFRLGKDVGEKSTFYIKADVLHEFLGDQDIEARDATGLLSTTYENEGTWYDIGLGFSHQFSKGTYMYLDMEKSIGNDNEDTYQFNFGMNWKV